MITHSIHARALTVATLLSLIGCATAPPAATAATEARSESALQALIVEHDRAWNAHDPDAMTALFVEDGSLITPGGKQVEGHAALRALFASPGPTKQSTSSTELDGVRFLSPDLALLDATQTLSSALPAMDGAQARLVAVARGVGGTWRFVAARPFANGGAQ